MEVYPTEYVEHNLPLILLSGLGEVNSEGQPGSKATRQEYGTRLTTVSPECQGHRAAQLLQHLLGLDGSEQPWNSTTLPGPSGLIKYKMKLIGRTYTLPARKAAPLPQSPSAESFQTSQTSLPRGSELHSPLSPLSPSSPIYPDGVFTPQWLAKHQEQIPSVLLTFFDVSSDETSPPDEQVQTDINAIKTALSRSGFKTRFAAVLLSDKSILQAPGLDERLSAIRRATTLDSKTGLFFMPPMSSPAEIATYIQSILTTLQPLSVEYYRDLTKHARRKKVRGGSTSYVASPVSGGSQSLSTPGWNVRYEVKQGIFAEFRQEMDVAERHYSAAIDELFNAEGIFEATASWSPRWDEGRLLCDALALRIIRCQLWTSLTTGAVVSWVNYKARMKDLVDRRGKGSQTYGWAAWESRWAEIMAQLIQRAQLASLRVETKTQTDESGELTSLQIFARPEAGAAVTDRLPPFHFLHHSGYWYRLAVQSARLRLQRALEIPEDDRAPPRQSTASPATIRSKNYDTYLVPDPHDEAVSYESERSDHVSASAVLTREAVVGFDARAQVRLSARLTLDLARDYFLAQHYDVALEMLKALWEDNVWRDDGWANLFAELLLLLHNCAKHAGSIEIVLSTAWELLAISSTTKALLGLDITTCLKDFAAQGERVNLQINGLQRLGPLSVSFAFGDKETHVGEPLECQLVISSNAGADSVPFVLAEVEVNLSSGTCVHFYHKADGDSVVDRVQAVDLTEHSDVDGQHLNRSADLDMSPSTKRVLNFLMNFKDAESIHLRHILICVQADNFRLTHIFPADVVHKLYSMQIANGGKLERAWLTQVDTHAVTVLPKPPKVHISLSGVRKQYYTDEIIQVNVNFINEEAETVNGNAHVHVLEEHDHSANAHWAGEESTRADLSFNDIQPAKSYKALMILQAPQEKGQLSVAIEIRYTLASEPNSLLSKSLTVELAFVPAFEVSFDFIPLLYPDPWPSYFNAARPQRETEPTAIPQRWRLGSQVRSLATESLILHSVTLVEDETPLDARCNVADPGMKSVQTLAPSQSIKSEVELTISKSSFDDRRSTVLELSVRIAWSRETGLEKAMTLLPVPRLTLPSSEPRILCTIADTLGSTEQLVLEYHLENPSTHFLTFALSMEASELFAFSGPKYRTLSLAPLSRHRVEYRIHLHDVDKLEQESDGYWIWPSLQVVDSYYQKSLKVHSGGPGVRYDEARGLSVLVQLPCK